MPKKKSKSKRGGKREGARRPLKYGEPIKVIQIKCPESKVKEFRLMAYDWLGQFIIKKEK
jgi:hypothetical protein